MRKTTALLALALSSTPALAGGQADSLGVGAEYMLNGYSGGLSANYDLGKFHFGGFIGFLDPGEKRGDDTSDFTLGGRFYYHLHSTAMSDFSLGGSVGVYSDQIRNGAGDTNRDTYIFVEPSLQIRCFVAANVALSFSAGLTLGLQDEDGFAVGGGKIDGNDGAIGGLVTGAAGIHYYFF